MLAGVLATLFFAWNGNQMFEDLEVKQSIMIHHVKVTGTPTFTSITGARALTIVPFVFFCIFRNGWIDCRDTFMLFSVYNIA